MTHRMPVTASVPVTVGQAAPPIVAVGLVESGSGAGCDSPSEESYLCLLGSQPSPSRGSDSATCGGVSHSDDSGAAAQQAAVSGWAWLHA